MTHVYAAYRICALIHVNWPHWVNLWISACGACSAKSASLGRGIAAVTTICATRNALSVMGFPPVLPDRDSGPQQAQGPGWGLTFRSTRPAQHAVLRIAAVKLAMLCRAAGLCGNPVQGGFKVQPRTDVKFR